VGDRAFKGSAITYMTIPGCYTSIGTEAFADCADLVYFFMGNGVTSAYNGWLEGCPNITSLWVEPGNPAYSYTNETLYDKSMTRLIRCSHNIEGTLTLPSTVTAIEPGAFFNCDKLNIVDMRKTTPNWGGLYRNLSNNPIYGANPYTLFILNSSSSTDNSFKGEPNIVVEKNGSGASYYCQILNIDDSRGLVSPMTINVTNINYNRKFAASLSYDAENVEGRTADYVYRPKAYTLCLPFAARIPYGNGLKLYNCTGVITEDGITTVTFTELGKNNSTGYYGNVHPCYPYYLVMEGEDAINISASGEYTIGTGTGGSFSVGNYDFLGTYVTIPNETLYNENLPAYILQSDGNWHKVPQNQPKAYVGPFRAYFRAKSASAARALYTNCGDGDETGIHQTVMRTIDHDGTEHYYDLNGHRLSGKPQQGIYIHQGKKHVAK
jgi:hypothetical protein